MTNAALRRSALMCTAPVPRVSVRVLLGLRASLPAYFPEAPVHAQCSQRRPQHLVPCTYVSPSATRTGQGTERPAGTTPQCRVATASPRESPHMRKAPVQYSGALAPGPLRFAATAPHGTEPRRRAPGRLPSRPRCTSAQQRLRPESSPPFQESYTYTRQAYTYHVLQARRPHVTHRRVAVGSRSTCTGACV